MRVVAVQSSNMVAYYLQDQLQADFEREELVKQSKLSEKDADEQQEEWEEREWNLRLGALPQKIINGLAKYHAITLVMRLYESIAAHVLVDEYTLDRLTMDSFTAANRVAKRSVTSTELRSDVTDICLWSSVIAFLADYSVHQIILTWTYYQYHQQRKLQRKSTSTTSTTSGATTTTDASGSGSSTTELSTTYTTRDYFPMALSYLTKSTSLFFSRAVSWIASAYGGAWGCSMFAGSYPDWACLMGSQFCDGVVASVFDELDKSNTEVVK